MAGLREKAMMASEILKKIPDIAHMAQAIRKKRIEEYGDDNVVDDSAERRKDGIARKAGKTKKSIFGGSQGLLGEHRKDD